MDAKFFPYAHAIQAVLGGMLGRRSGAIVNVVGAGGKAPRPYHVPGGAANAALMLVTAGLAHAHAGSGVRINAINPGLTLTDRVFDGLAAEAKYHGIREEEALKKGDASIPLGRSARPEEIADVAVFLASPRASYITGAVLTMDGSSSPSVV
jgi:NAD(P)-dependent dehydrogenase (short-subunit alcohol dehydrogenase family)